MARDSNDGDLTTWNSPAQQVEVNDPDLGQLRVRVWQDLHFRLSPSHPMSVLLVERLSDGCARVSKPMWLAFVGLSMPPACEVWRLYLRRFAIDHWYRFAKNRRKDSGLKTYSSNAYLARVSGLNYGFYLALLIVNK
jgi:hypothetical protein